MSEPSRFAREPSADVARECGADLLQQQEQRAVESELEVGTVAASSTAFKVAIEKTENGFGIFFTKREQEGDSGPNQCLVVDGFVEDPSDADDGLPYKTERIAKVLQVGDVLIGINEADCQKMDPMEIIRLLRSAPLGVNTFLFRRYHGVLADKCDDDHLERKDTPASITQSLRGVLRKVRTKIKEGIEGDEEQLLQEQQEQELFEKTWLAEFDRLKQEYETKWETCTYTADEFCGLLYHSGDQQQKEYLLREYPVLIEAWKYANLSAPSIRIRPDWPSPKVSYAEPIVYHPFATPESDNQRIERSVMQQIAFSPSLYKVLETLQREFMWRRRDVLAFGVRLEAAEIYCCTDLVLALEMRSAYFERNFQSIAYPRLTKALCRALLQRAQSVAKDVEDMSGKSMDQLKVNNAA
uniref:PDZ domain-containing protein n=1 Tax=Globisporangium ultimum (strain ATCC 200006 / CBS 805.95 / DAOM BR144) TaxID=431595 RepID=K3WYY0_GLOUD